MKKVKLLKYAKEYKFSATIGFLFKIFEAVLELCVPVVMASVIDKGIGNNDPSYINWTCRIWVFICLGLSMVCIFDITKCGNTIKKGYVSSNQYI